MRVSRAGVPDTMTRQSRPWCGLRRLLPAVLLFIVGQTWIMLVSLQYTVRQEIGDTAEIPSGPTQTLSRSTPLQDEKYTAKLVETLRTILARHSVDTSNFQYNVSVGDRLSVRRPIPDTRLPECRNTTFPGDTAITVSVVIIFHNEALSTVLRTVHSVIDRSPANNLKEVILVDDASTMSYLKDDLDRYLSLVPKTTLIRNRKREGLVRSRMAGARFATGDVLVFFDAHMECNKGWLEPLLYTLRNEPNAILQPDVDVIAASTMEYYGYGDGRRSRGGFGWDLRYAWFEVPGYIELALKSKTAPFVTPVLVGNAIVVRRNHFFSIGGFDEGLDIWGGEHFDLSFKNWMCAGRVLTVPCSKVGHLFKTGGQSYSFGGDRSLIILKNLMRVAEMWMDEFKEIFYKVSGSRNRYFPKLNKNSLKAQRDFMKSLNCKPFRWYLENVLPEQKIPPHDAAYYGEITNVKTSACLAVLDDWYIGMTYKCFKYRILPENSFTFSKKGEFKYNDYCIFIDNTNLYLKADRCGQTHGVMHGKWSFQTEDPSSKTGILKFEEEGTAHALCATHVTGAIPNDHFNEQMAQASISCANSSSYQSWTFMYKLHE